MHIVAPLLCNSPSSSMTASPFRESRFPVGSSASRIDGSPATARARPPLLLAPGRLAREMLRPLTHPDAFQRCEDPRLPLCGPHAGINQRQLDVLVDGQIANQVEALEDESDFAVADARTLRWLQVRGGLIMQLVFAVAGRIEQAENGRSVDLPQPDGPAIDTYRPRGSRDRCRRVRVSRPCRC